MIDMGIEMEEFNGAEGRVPQCFLRRNVIFACPEMIAL
jgi:hypothetical protein